jgi:hypothetical protein
MFGKFELLDRDLGREYAALAAGGLASTLYQQYDLMFIDFT